MRGALILALLLASSPVTGQELPLNRAYRVTRREVAPGVAHLHLQSPRTRTRAPLSVHVLRVELRRARVAVAVAQDRIQGKERTSSLARRRGALAAINGGFFATRGPLRGDPDGLLVIDGEVLSHPAETRTSLSICDGSPQRPALAWPRLVARATGPGGRSVEIGRINGRRFVNGLVLYTDRFGDSTLTGDGGLEVIVDKVGRVAAVSADRGSMGIPRGGFVLSAAGTRVGELSRLAVPGQPLTLSLALLDRRARRRRLLPTAGCSYISAGPSLIRRGRVLPRASYRRESRRFVRRRFCDRRHPRTAVGIDRRRRTLLLVTVDGRQEDLSAGMTLPELARLLRRQGAHAAYNLDGGGSTTMVIGERVVNSPSDRGVERPVSDALLVLTPGGAVR